jgi:phage shock protein A
MNEEIDSFAVEARRVQEQWWSRWMAAIDRGYPDLANIAAERIADLENGIRARRCALLGKGAQS